MTHEQTFKFIRGASPEHARGITSVCSAHPLVLTAAIGHATRTGAKVLIEATCNQVNHLGGYTGMRPADFAARVHAIADEVGLDHGQVILGGDHLGPNPWRKQAAENAMKEAEAMVAAYIAAGFTKIHLDASMGCHGEPEALDDETTAHRSARLASVAEHVSRHTGIAPPVYIIGTEVPPPGGADHALTTIEPTRADAARRTIAIHRQVFTEAGLADAFARVVGVVVQPGVEFGNENVIRYDRRKTVELCNVLDTERDFSFEAHSTDYQGRLALRALVQDGFSILKVGPELTFALREALYGLDLIASDLFADYPQRALYTAMEDLMVAHPDEWTRHYAGSGAQRRIQRHYSFSDRIRYYWTRPEAMEAVSRLFEKLRGVTVPITVLRQHLPQFQSFSTGPLDPEAVAIAAVGRVLDDYHFACTERAGEGAPNA